jgi:hypothetical protein
VALEGDPVWARACAVLARARVPRDVFAAAAPLAAPAVTPARRPPVKPAPRRAVAR